MKAAGRPLGEYELKRNEIADATWSVIAERGLEGASMRAIARQAGYTTGALVHYFESKEEILEYSLTQSFERVQQLFEDALDHEDVLASLRDIAMSYLPLDEQSKKIMSAWQSFLAVAEKNPKMFLTIQSVFRGNHERLTRLIGLGQERGLIRDDKPAGELADLLNALNEGLVRIAPFEPDRLSPEHLVRMVDLTINLIKK